MADCHAYLWEFFSGANIFNLAVLSGHYLHILSGVLRCFLQIQIVTLSVLVLPW